MIENLNRFIAYICPDCSGISDMSVGLFDFSGKSEITLTCIDKTCKGKTGILHMKDDKIKLVNKGVLVSLLKLILENKRFA